MKPILSKFYAILFSALFVSACASALNVLDNVQRGQSEEQAKEAVRTTPKWTIENERTTYLVYGYIVSPFDMADNTVTYYFVKLEEGRVVDKGMVRKRQRDEIKVIDPDFDTTQLIRQPNN